MQKDSRLIAFLRRDGIALLLTAGMFWLTYKIVFGFRMGMTDFTQHSVWALAMTKEDMVYAILHGRGRLWHILVKLVFDRTHNMWSAAALVTAAANASAHYLVYRFLEESAPEKLPRWLLALLTHILFLVNAVSWPGAAIVSDRGFVNVWHNPTNMILRPFAAAVFFMTLRIYNRRRCGEHHVLVPTGDGARPFAFSGGFGSQFREPVFTWPELILYPLCLLLSVYAKPAFIMYFAPAIFLFFLVDLYRSKGMLFPFCLKLAIAFLPAVIVTYGQFMQYFGAFASVADAVAASGARRVISNESLQAALTSDYEGYNPDFITSGVAVYYILPQFSGMGEVLRETVNALLLTIWLCAFPLAVFIIDFDIARHSAAFRLSFWGVIVARIESLMLHELGIREGDGNFRWAYFVAAWLFFAVAVERWGETFAESSRRGKLMRYVAGPLLLWQAGVGVFYIVRILMTHGYWY